MNTLALSPFVAIPLCILAIFAGLAIIITLLFLFASSPNAQQKEIATKLILDIEKAQSRPCTHWWKHPDCQGYIHALLKDKDVYTAWISTREKHATIYTNPLFDWHDSPLLDRVEKLLKKKGWVVSRAAAEGQPELITGAKTETKPT